MSSEPSGLPRVWLVRGAKDEQFDPWMIENEYAAIDFGEFSELSDATDLHAMKKKVQAQMPDSTDRAVTTYAAQLNAFVNKIAIGDIVVLPLKKEGLLAFGTVTGEYLYIPDSDGLKHVRKVTWDRPNVSRTSIKQDLLYSLGAFSTVCEIRRNDAAYRLQKVVDGADSDPGARATSPTAPSHDVDVEIMDSDTAIESEGQDIIRYSRDRILAHIREEYAGHALEGLVAEILQAEGMTCKVQDKGADGGIDIIAGSGLLGISAPTIIVQVKSQDGPIGSAVLDQLGGVVGQHQADHGLLVAMGGLTSHAKKKVAAQRLRVAVWDAEELLNRLLAHYEEMPESVKRKIPLRRAWLIDESKTN